MSSAGPSLAKTTEAPNRNYVKLRDLDARSLAKTTEAPNRNLMPCTTP